MGQTLDRRGFLGTVPLALTACISPGMERLFAQSADAQAAPVHDQPAFRLISAQTLATREQSLRAAPGNDNLVAVPSLPFTLVLTVEKNKSALEFEWHEGRDHIVQITEGATRYEVGGQPERARTVKPGEWLAPASTGATTFVLHPGDMLVIPRGTPHRRSTGGSVTFLLISTTG